jgi:glycosyltransferase involved in cell wall biosynthesis
MILSTVDVRAKPNNREHHLMRHMAAQGIEVWVVYRRDCRQAGLAEALRDALVPWARVLRENGITFVEVNPPLNHAHGLVDALTADVSADREHGLLRRCLGRLVAELGIVKDIATILALAFFVWRHGPARVDLAAGLSPWGAAAGLLLCRLGRVAAVFYEDRDFEPGFMTSPLRRRWAGCLERYGIRRADGGLSIGRRLATLRREQTGCDLPVVPTGIDLPESMPPVPPPRRRLVYTGHVAPWSGLEQVMEAMARLRPTAPELTLMVIGDGPPAYIEGLKRLAARLDLQLAVAFTGRLSYPCVRKVLAEGGIGLALFRPEPLRAFAVPLKVLDYMLAGLPILATQDTESAELVERHDAGIVLAYGSDALTTALPRLLDDRASWLQMACNGQAAVAQYDWATLLNREQAIVETTWRAALLRQERRRRSRAATRKDHSPLGSDVSERPR